MTKAVEEAERAKSDMNPMHIDLAFKQRRKIENELQSLAQSCCELIDKHLMAHVNSDEQRVFYLKMMGDYNRYLCEFMDGEQRTTAMNASRAGYQVG